MPLQNTHACRLKSPSAFQSDSFRSMEREHDGKKYRVIMGRLTGETKLTDQAFRYNKDIWTESSAERHCGNHDGKFEPAVSEENTSLRSEHLGMLDDEHKSRDLELEEISKREEIKLEDKDLHRVVRSAVATLRGVADRLEGALSDGDEEETIEFTEEKFVDDILSELDDSEMTFLYSQLEGGKINFFETLLNGFEHGSN